MLYLTYMSTIDRFLNRAIKVLLVCITCIMLIIGLLFVTPVTVHALDFSSYFSNQKNSGDTGSSSVNISGNSVTITANKTSYGYNTSVDFCIGYTCWVDGSRRC